MAALDEFPESFPRDAVTVLKAVSITTVPQLAAMTPETLANMVRGEIARHCRRLRGKLSYLVVANGEVGKTMPDVTMFAGQMVAEAKRLIEKAQKAN